MLRRLELRGRSVRRLRLLRDEQNQMIEVCPISLIGGLAFSKSIEGPMRVHILGWKTHNSRLHFIFNLNSYVGFHPRSNVSSIPIPSSHNRFNPTSLSRCDSSSDPSEEETSFLGYCEVFLVFRQFSLNSITEMCLMRGFVACGDIQNQS